MMSDRYAKVYTYLGIGIYALKVAFPAGGDDLGYVIDDDRFRGKSYLDAIDKVKDPVARQSYEAK